MGVLSSTGIVDHEDTKASYITLNFCQLRLECYFSTASANLAPGNQELLHLSSVKF